MESEVVWKGRRVADDDFFHEGNDVCKAFIVEGIVTTDSEELCHNSVPAFACDEFPCSQTFTSIFDYDLHYRSSHQFTCCECKKVLPSSHLLDIHVSERHDSFFKVQAQTKPVYQCFVEDCTVKSRNAHERRSHCITEHGFPHDFRYYELPKNKSNPRKKIKTMQNEVKDMSEETEMEVSSDFSDILPMAGCEEDPAPGDAVMGDVKDSSSPSSKSQSFSFGSGSRRRRGQSRGFLSQHDTVPQK